MKKIGLFLVLLLSMVPVWANAQDVTGGEIEEIAASVVMIETLRGQRAFASGTGTIVSEDGQIYTNQHVIEGGDDFAIYMLSADIGEQPTLRYYASLTYVSDQLDFAILQIDRDERGQPVDASQQALPYLPPQHSDEVSIGDSVRIFGYPGIGEDYLIVTSGEIVGVQNGTIGGDRLPVWYRTDAEISGGNSGGLAVNADGEFIGVPTWVLTEERTAGRLGGVLPISAIQREVNANPEGATNRAQRSRDGEVVSLTVINDSLAAICAAYISPTTASLWGEDQLGGQIPAGGTHIWNWSPGTYDLLLVDCNGDTLEDFRNINVEGFTTFTYTPGRSTFVSEYVGGAMVGEVTFTVNNNSRQNICYVYISLTTANTWGADQLGASEIIRRGATRSWSLEPGLYDVRLQDCNRQDLEDIRGVDMTTNEYVLTYP